MPRPLLSAVLSLALLWMGGCQSSPSSSTDSEPSPADTGRADAASVQTYATIRLDADLRALPQSRRDLVSHLIEAAQTMDGVFWEQAYGNRDSLLQSIGDPQRRRLVRLNYGPWDRTRNDVPLVDGVGPRPPGANFYPEGLSADSLRRAARTDASIAAPRTMVRRLPDGRLTALPYHRFFAAPMSSAAFQLRDAARLASSDALRRVLEQRAEALTTGEYAASLRAWHALDAPQLDALIGPMPTGEDRLLGVKESAAAVVLRRDSAWHRRLGRLSDRLSSLRTRGALPNGEGPNQTDPRPRLEAYDVLYAAGGANVGSKPTVLPFEAAPPGTEGRRLLLANVVQARADSLLRPLAAELVSEEQRPHVSAEALADYAALHGSLPRTEVDRSSSAAVEALRRTARALVLAPALATREEMDTDSLDYYATALADLLRAVRVDSSSARGRAALASIQYFRERGAVVRDTTTSTYAVVPDTMARVLPRLLQSSSANVLRTYGTAPAGLRSALARLDDAGVPRALAFEQGPSVLRGLTPATAAR